MKNETFVFISSDSVKIYSENIKKEIYFEDKGVRNVSPLVMSVIIREALDEYALPDNNIVLVPGPEYVVCTEKITSHVKKSNDQEPFVKDMAIRVPEVYGDMNSFIMSQKTRFVCNGKTVRNFEAVPLLQKYFANRLITEFEAGYLSELLANLYKNDIAVKSIMPSDSLMPVSGTKQAYCDRQILLSFGRDKTFASVSEGGVIVKSISYASGMRKVAEDVSNNFNISVNTAVKMVDLYGFVFLPKEYLNYVIDVPVYGNVYQNIGLADLTYCIRESLKEIFNGILSNLSAKMRDYDINSEFVCEASVSINGMGDLLKLILNRDVEFISCEDFEYRNMINIYHEFAKSDLELKKQAEAPQLQAQAEVTEQQPAFMDRLANLFNTRIKPLILEADA